MSIDGPTLVFQIVNFLVLLVLLSRLMFRPLLRHMRERRERMTADLDAIEQKAEAVEAARAEVARQEAQAARAEAEALEAARRAAEVEKARLLDSARAAADEERRRLTAQLDAERARAEEAVTQALAPLVARTLERLLTEIAGDVPLHAAACARLAERLETLEPKEEKLEVESATGELTPELERAVARLAEAGRREIVRRVPSLVAGARVRLGDVVYDGSVKSQVERAVEGGP